MKKAVPFSAAATLVAAALAIAAPARAETAGAAPAEPAKDSRVVTLSAYVSSDGGLIRKRGAIRSQGANGAYTVGFNRKVVGCFYSATAAAGGPFIATAQGLEGDLKAVFVQIYWRDGQQTAAPFYLVVTCYE